MISRGAKRQGAKPPRASLRSDEIAFLMLGRWVCGRRAGRGGKPCGRSRQGAKRPEGPSMGFPTPERSEPPGARSASSTYPRAARSAEIKEGGSGETKCHGAHSGQGVGARHPRHARPSGCAWLRVAPLPALRAALALRCAPCRPESVGARGVTLRSRPSPSGQGRTRGDCF